MLSHEIGHGTTSYFRNISVQNRAQWTSVAGYLPEHCWLQLVQSAAMAAIQGGQGLAQQNMLSFSRDYEREADRVGQQLMYQAGFDAHAMPEFFSGCRMLINLTPMTLLAFYKPTQ